MATKEALKEEIHEILKNADLSVISAKKVRLQLEKKLKCDLLPRRDEIDKIVMDFVNAQEVVDSDNESESLKMALSAANLKLKLSPSTDTIVDERHFASKCVLDALDELKKIIDKIDERLDKLEKMTNINLKKKSDIRFKAVVTFISIVLFLGICLWGKQFI